MFYDELKRVFKTEDLPNFDAWYPRYQKLHDLVQSLEPTTAVEIGVRAGYSAWTMFQACPRLHLIGLDFNGNPKLVNTHGGELDYYQHALEICKPYNFHLLLVNSHDIIKLPKCDLCYIDGDHGLSGCLEDLELADKSTNTILCDDYNTVFRDGVQEVRHAINHFCNEHKYRGAYIDNSSTGLFLIQK